MPVVYDSKRLLPVQSVNIDKQYTRGESGKFRKVNYVVTVQGTLVSTKGSPLTHGGWWGASGEPPDATIEEIADFTNRLAILRDKMGTLDKLFEVRGKLFEVIPHDATTSIRFIPRVTQITYQQGSPQIDWLEKLPYTITMETDRIQFGGYQLGENEKPKKWDCDESWSIEPNDDRNRTYKVTHSLSASGIDEYDPAGTGTLLRKGWKVAKEDKVEPNLVEMTGFVIQTAGLEDETETTVDIRTVSKTGIDNTWERYNFVKTENIDEPAGRYSITETWILYDGALPYLEEYTVSTRTSAEDGRVSVSVDGTITGFNTEDPPGEGDRFANAEVGWAIVEPLLITRAQTYSGQTLNAVGIGKTVGKNIFNGVITYNYEYSNKPTATVAGAISDNVTINDDLPNDVFAKHVCVLRSIGPVLQDIFTQTESRRNVTVEVQMPAATTTFTPSEPDVSAIIAMYTPTADYEGPYVDKHSKTWNPQSGRYTKVVSWSWV